ncbi:MAG: lipopolysaccharide biosynthesis protein [Planctomycetota bacterium]|nr:lipopolysaccharide biosynthesis protein [Planctomycetota bacterium]
MSSVTVLRILAQFLAVPILARLLSPIDYGVVAMAMPFVLFAMMIADAGIGMSLVRTPLSERGTWSTCFWLSAILGSILAVTMAILAPVAAMVFDERELEPIVRTLGLVVFAQAISSVPGAALQRSQKYKCIAVTEMAGIAVGIGTAIVVASYGYGAWALVSQQLAFYAMRLCLTFYFSRFVPAMVWDLQGVKEHLAFGRDVLSVNIVGFFTRSIDNLVIGKALGAAAVGVYSMSFQFARLPIMLVTGPLQFVLYGQCAAANTDAKAICSMFLILTQLLAIAVIPTMGMIAAAYHPVFSLLLSEKWAASGVLFMLASPACAFQAVTALCSTILLVLGRAEVRLRMTLEFGALWIVGLLIGASIGLNAVAVLYNLVVIIYLPRTFGLVLPMIDCPAKSYWRAVRVPIYMTAACVCAHLMLTYYLRVGDVGQLAVAAVLWCLCTAICWVVQMRGIVSEVSLLRLAELSHSTQLP